MTIHVQRGRDVALGSAAQIQVCHAAYAQGNASVLTPADDYVVKVDQKGGFAEQRPEWIVRRRGPMAISHGPWLRALLLAGLRRFAEPAAVPLWPCFRLFQKPKASFSDRHRHATAGAMPINSLAVKNSKAGAYLPVEGIEGIEGIERY